jgi:hypothetical protein
MGAVPGDRNALTVPETFGYGNVRTSFGTSASISTRKGRHCETHAGHRSVGRTFEPST